VERSYKKETAIRFYKTNVHAFLLPTRLREQRIMRLKGWFQEIKKGFLRNLLN